VLLDDLHSRDSRRVPWTDVRSVDIANDHGVLLTMHGSVPLPGATRSDARRVVETINVYRELHVDHGNG
jgi:hypothetical protein